MYIIFSFDFRLKNKIQIENDFAHLEKKTVECESKSSFILLLLDKDYRAIIILLSNRTVLHGNLKLQTII